MKKYVLLICFLAMPLITWAQGKVPQFKDYSVNEIYRGKNAPVKMTKDNRDYRTRLKNIANGKPNFAGRYIVETWGCGHRCLTGGMMDAKTGKFYFIGSVYEGEAEDSMPNIDYRLNSSLMIFYGTTDDKGSGKHYFKFKSGKLIHIKTTK